MEAAVQSRSLGAWYSSVPRYDLRQTHSASRAPGNVEKNRYSDIVAYDSTRVLLTPNEFNGQSDYINANHVNMTLTGSNTVYRYIATQGPKSSTVSDFWQLILEQGIRQIVMLTTLQEGDMIKCFKYWPEEGTKMKDLLGSWSIQQVGMSQEDAWIQRQFEVKNEKTGEERHVTHLQYVKWPDHGVPQDSQDFVDFVHLVREFRAEAPIAPVVVHCSAGVGRTGVFIMMETAMGLIEEGQAVRPQQLLQIMREQRPSLVQTESQFNFVVGAILRVFIEGSVQPCS
ncbi:tyrosine-protein phosphatase non-receptor type 3 [Galendromus occidentalis]|uniref:Tyrosine-protein phosphatase non-receptor type 3 n=1 Tax=Galendromus occidentalis TaxID=34638 RepID=A0AAJ7SH65_9ACAR|nr:tyrosine-protein phosphatase non-receptor type 3 [Galendromus occidentalis]